MPKNNDEGITTSAYTAQSKATLLPTVRLHLLGMLELKSSLIRDKHLRRETAKARRIRRVSPSLNLFPFCYPRFATCNSIYSTSYYFIAMQPYICSFPPESISTSFHLDSRYQYLTLSSYIVGYWRLRIIYQLRLLAPCTYYPDCLPETNRPSTI
jgi:hypothetical protein